LELALGRVVDLKDVLTRHILEDEKNKEQEKNEIGRSDMLSNDDRQKALDGAIGQIEKDYGKGSIMRLGDENALVEIETIPTGSLLLDRALGIGGVPKGRIVEIYGPESSGKTTLTLHIVAEAQKRGGLCAFIDAEHALDPTYAKALGVDTENLLVSQPDHGEQALAIADKLIRSNALSVIVVDSVAALVPKSEIEGEMGDYHVGTQARLMSQAMRKLTSTVAKSSTVLVFINQIRMKIGVMFGNPETTTGGNALKFYSSIRMDIRRIGTVKVGTEAVANRTRVKVVKNKLAPPFREAEFEISFGEGISRMGELIDLGLEHNILTRAGTWFSYGEERLGQGRDNVKRLLKERPELAVKLESEIRVKMELPPLETKAPSGKKKS
jgi:recombination protein RecA